ncbi:MAG: hypothetical protein ACJAS1_004717 [Oleiphilaceae bacterium]|jgi:hypothetical protein
MTYKILYIEDAEPDTIISEISKEFTVIHHDPKEFEIAINKITDDIDLLLLDFRLSDKEAIYDAPTIAQTVRTKNTMNHKNLPIVLISSEDNISDFYKDYTSQDLFDFAVSKKDLLENINKYSSRLKSLIRGYVAISAVNTDIHKNLKQLLNCPELIAEKLSPRIIETLESEKHTADTYMASDFILNHIVKPIGILIGEDVLLSRLGIMKGSKGWEELKTHLEDYRYTGVFKESYNRWWFSGVEDWWKKISPEEPSLKRLKASERKLILEQKLDINELNVAQKSECSKSEYFWTICAKHQTPLDPIDGFESVKNTETWEDKEYFSLIAVSELESLKQITPLSRKRYIEATG